MYIVFEGIVGTGKTTQIRLLLSFLEQKFPEIKIVVTREPGGSEVADHIRKVVQGTAFRHETMNPVCTAFLYAASRAQMLRTFIGPALQRGEVVLADRSFASSLAFQGYAEGLGLQKVLEINSHAIEGYLPDLVLFLDLAPEIALTRTSDAGGDRWEAKGISFFQKVIEGYAAVAALPIFAERWARIDASGSPKDVFDRIKKVVLNELASV